MQMIGAPREMFIRGEVWPSPVPFLCDSDACYHWVGIGEAVQQWVHPDDLLGDRAVYTHVGCQP